MPDSPADLRGECRMAVQPRSSVKIIYETWKALFLRAAVNSLSGSRTAWFWLLVEPIAFIVLLMWVFTALRVRTIGGIDTAIWVMAGVLSFLVFRRAAVQSMMALVGVNKLFTYPQIRPVDPVLVAASLEGFLMLIVTVILLAGAWMYGLDVIPDDPLAVMEALLGLWLLGVGFGLVGSVANKLMPPIGAVMSFTMRPLYFLSGVMFPVTLIPYPYLDWFKLNPLVHGLEAARLGFAPYYYVSSDLSISYLYGWAIATIFFGFALHVRYANQLDKK